MWMASTTKSTNGNRKGEEPMEFIAVYEKDGSWVASMGDIMAEPKWSIGPNLNLRLNGCIFVFFTNVTGTFITFKFGIYKCFSTERLSLSLYSAHELRLNHSLCLTVELDHRDVLCCGCVGFRAEDGPGGQPAEPDNLTIYNGSCWKKQARFHLYLATKDQG